MTENQILDDVRKVLKEHLQISSPVGLETLKQLTLVVELENHFRICFEEGEEEGLRTIGDVVEFIANRITSGSTEGAHPDA